MKQKRYKRNYRWLIVPLLLFAVIGIGIAVICYGLFRDDIQSERIPHPVIERVSIASLKEHPDCVWDESLLLVNAKHPLDEDFQPSLCEYNDSGLSMSHAITDAYAKLSQAVAAHSNDTLYISSAYRTQEEQAVLYEDDPTIAAKPRTSEHETGLALDLYVSGYAGKEFIKSRAGQYVNEHCGEYGFIIRYPLGKSAITGFPYESWHVRYVGVAHSSRIKQYDLTWEEYIDELKIGTFYRHNTYIISRQKADEETLLLPVECNRFHISPDNTGCYIITGTVKEDSP